MRDANSRETQHQVQDTRDLIKPSSVAMWNGATEVDRKKAVQQDRIKSNHSLHFKHQQEKLKHCGRRTNNTFPIIYPRFACFSGPQD